MWDAHCWLEDKNGGVFDYSFRMYEVVSVLRVWKCGDLRAGEVLGESKAACVKRGLTYVPAPPKVQEWIRLDLARAGLVM